MSGVEDPLVVVDAELAPKASGVAEVVGNDLVGQVLLAEARPCSW